MFNNSSKIMFFNILIMGTLITISANSWMTAWMGLEINLLSFIPLMSNNKLMSTEASLKYFLTQALASSVFLFAVILLLMNLKIMNLNYMKLMIFFSLLMKSGTPPFHFWFSSVMEGLSWYNSLILLTWQKIAPLMLIFYVIFKPFITLSIILSTLIGALGGLNQTSLRKLMVYSSINHLGWMLAAMNNNSMLWITYFLIYTFLTFMMIYMFNMFKMNYINQLMNLFLFKNSMKFNLFFNLLSLGGLPPFLGFFPKMLVIQLMIMNNQLLLLLFMMMMTLITLYFYLRLCYSAFMLNYYENNWLKNSNYKLFMMKIFTFNWYMSTFGLFLISSLYFWI